MSQRNRPCLDVACRTCCRIVWEQLAAMLVMCMLLILLWLLIMVSLSLQSVARPRIIDLSGEQVSSETRGYGYGYSPGPPAYQIIPFFEPIVILSAIAFIAYLIQTFHILYLVHRQVINTPAAVSTSLLGGVVDSLVPTRHRTLSPADDQLDDILSVICLKNLAARKKRRRKPNDGVKIF